VNELTRETLWFDELRTGQGALSDFTRYWMLRPHPRKAFKNH